MATDIVLFSKERGPCTDLSLLSTAPTTVINFGEDPLESIEVDDNVYRGSRLTTISGTGIS